MRPNKQHLATSVDNECTHLLAQLQPTIEDIFRHAVTNRSNCLTEREALRGGSGEAQRREMHGACLPADVTPQGSSEGFAKPVVTGGFLGPLVLSPNYGPVAEARLQPLFATKFRQHNLYAGEFPARPTPCRCVRFSRSSIIASMADALEPGEPGDERFAERPASAMTSTPG